MSSPYYSVVPVGEGLQEDPYAEVGAPFTPVPVQGYVNYNYEIGRKGKAPGQFGGWVQHFTASKDGKLLYACDLWNKRVQVFDLLKRKPISSFPTTMEGFNFQAQGIQVFRDGNLCINCVGFDGTSRIGIFTPEGRKIRSFGPGVIGSTSAIAVDNMDRITVIDRRKMRISTCSREGRLLESFDPGIKTDLLRLCCNSKGHVIVPNHLKNQVVVFDPYGTPIHLIRPLSGCGYEFKYPAGVACDCNDSVFVCDVGNHRVLQFNADCEFRGALLTKRDHKLWRPHDLAATSQGDMIVSEVSETFMKIFNFSPKQY